MNNLLPSTIEYHEKYDLKVNVTNIHTAMTPLTQGSSYKRFASPEECSKAHPTYKDVDFIHRHPEVQYLWVGGASYHVMLTGYHVST